MGLLSPADWQARWVAVQTEDEKADRAAGLSWIWGPDPLAPKPQKFRFSFDLPAEPAEAVVMISAKDHLKGLWVNGEPLAVPETLFWGTMTPWPVRLRAGRNVVCVEAWAETTGFFPADGGGLAGFVKAKMSDGHVVRLGSGPAWRVSDADAAGWTAPGFDDRRWAQASHARSRVQNEPWPAVPPMLIRRPFSVDKPVTRARFYATALGAHDGRINGTRVGAGLRLAPEISVARDHILYQTYDVTPLLRPGANALGLVAGDGWYASDYGWRMERFGFGPGPRRILAQLVIDYADGSREVIGSGPDWTMSYSPLLSSEIYNGEVFDGRLRQPGWDTPDFTPLGPWMPMDVAAAPTTRLVAQVSPPIRPIEELKPVKVWQPKPGTFVYDFGQNFAGWCRVKAQGPAGTTLKLRFAEILKATGEVDTANLRGAKATDVFTLRGDPEPETFEPHFTYHGFRYVELTGYPGTPPQDVLTGVVAHTDCPPAGALQSANPLVQQIWSNALWSQRSNFFAVPTDCPQRDERMGWMGDIQVFLDAAAFNMDVDSFIRRFLLEVRAAQTPEGAYPIVVPQPLSFPDVVTSGWSEAGIILPWTLWRRYGDTRVIEDNWAAMSRWLAYVGDVNPDFVWRKRRGLDLGDWLSVDAIKPDDETTPRVLVATAYWAYVAELMGEMAGAVGRLDEAERYARLRSEIGRAFAAEFVKPDGLVGNGSQTSCVLALKFGLVPPPLQAAVAERLAADIRGRGMKLSTGFLGTPYLLDVLADHGQQDVAVGLLLQTEYPSWGYMIRKGATTMWERWNGDVGDVAMNSYNHYAFGAVAGFMYRRLAGLSPSAPGFTRLEVRPLYDPRIGRIRAEHQCRLGRVASDVDGDVRGVSRLALTVPANSTAEVVLPARGGWREGGKALKGRSDVRVLAQTPAELRLEVGAGSYLFTAV
jgi:alpha-L-rhamnosidase